jgi:two-component system LytT family response regulator
MDNRNLSFLIVDDEIEACKNLKNIILEYIDDKCNILGMAHSTKEAEIKIASLKPDVVFLDINMPNENAFQFLERINTFDFEIIFVTAYDHYAVKAFRLNAVDYILKPIHIEDLRKAIEKVRNKVMMDQFMENGGFRYNNLSDHINRKVDNQHLILSDNSCYEVVAFRDIVYLEAMGSYSKIFFLKSGIEKSMLMSQSISDYEEVLPENIFFRVHRSYLLNCSYISKILKNETNEVMLRTKATIPISRRRYSALVGFLSSASFNNV